MNKIFFVLIVCFSLFAFSFKVKENSELRRVPSSFRVVFWNCENLFDTINDPNKDDDDFTPSGKMNWTNERYQKKLTNLAKVLTNIPETRIVPFIGLCEVENETVLKDLLDQPVFAGKGYQYLHKDSPDERGIDVAFLYRDALFKIVSSEWLTVDLNNVGPKPDATREILYVKGMLMGDEIHVFVNHWPSRREGEEISEPKRMKAAETLRNKINEIKQSNPEAKIIVMGDFNDSPTDKSLVSLDEEFKTEKAAKNNTLFNAMYSLEKEKRGTLYHDGEFNTFDQILVSGSLVNPDTKRITSEDLLGKIFAPDWTCFIDPKSKQQRPNRTYAGSKYYGGFSDHFPVYYDLKMVF